MAEESFKLPYCPQYSSNVVISEYNENGKCKCLSCTPFATWCQTCEWRDKLVAERTSMINNKCMQCIQQK